MPLSPSAQTAFVYSLQTHDYNDCFIGSWLGAQVHLKQFKRKSLLSSARVIDQFLKELEVCCHLRHPNVIMYMGLSVDPAKYNAYIATEFFSTLTLFDIIHGAQRLLPG